MALHPKGQIYSIWQETIAIGLPRFDIPEDEGRNEFYWASHIYFRMVISAVKFTLHLTIFTATVRDSRIIFSLIFSQEHF